MADLPMRTAKLPLTEVEGPVRLWRVAPSEMRAAAYRDALIDRLVAAYAGVTVRESGEAALA